MRLRRTHLGCGLGRLETSGVEERHGSKSDLCSDWVPSGKMTDFLSTGASLQSDNKQIVKPESYTLSGSSRFCFPHAATCADGCANSFANSFIFTQLAEIICLFWMSNFMSVASFSCTERNCLVSASAFWWKCLPSLGKAPFFGGNVCWCSSCLVGA